MSKNWAFIVIALIIFGSFTPSISGYNTKTDYFESVNVQNETTLKCHALGRYGVEETEITLSFEEAERVCNKLNELQVEMNLDPFSEKTHEAKVEYIDLLAEKDLIHHSLTKNDYLSLLTPQWHNQWKKISINDLPSNGGIASSFICSVTSGGMGTLLPPFLPPRPRMGLSWIGHGVYDAAATAVGSLLLARGFMAIGEQTGIALGFTGVGLTYGSPVGPVYGLAGYALFVTVNAEYIETFPPNFPPEISDESPRTGSSNMPVSLSELIFRINDPNGDRMSYTVTTDPHIGSGSGNMKGNGVYTVSVSGLEPYKTYRWTVSVSDGKDTTEKTFSFVTEDQPLDPFNPFEEGWQYRKKITIQHAKVAGDLTDFPILVSIKDSDLRDKAQTDGDDILFMDSSSVANKLYHEIELFSKVSGEIVAWVRIPSVSSSVDTELYLYYGNLETSNQQFPEKTWNSNFKGVWHLNENPAETIQDSTINDNNGASHGSMTLLNMVDGKVGKCIDFDGIDDYISIPNSVSLCPSEVTLVCWLYPEELDLNGMFHIGKMCKDKWGNYDAASYGIHYDNRTVSTYYERNENGGFKVVANAAGIDRWYHIATSMDSLHNIKIYLDGILKNQSNCGQSIRYTNAKELYLAASHISLGSGINSWEDCKIDEIWILDVPLDDQWISTLYKNQNDPSYFLSFGPEEIGP
jgi:hypothetical protein